MKERNIRNLPLLEAFEAIMTRGSISGAAESMYVTQSAVSKQLNQLREWFGDELFVRTSKGMQPTPRALELRQAVQDLLAQARALFPEDLDRPQEFVGKFVLGATDEILARIVPPLVDRLGREAPDLRLTTLPVARDYLLDQLESGQVNLVVAVNWNAPELLKQKRLGSDPFVCVMHEQHPLAGSNLTLRRYADATHILVAPLGNDKGVVDMELDKHGLQRRICVSVSAFHMVDEQLLGTSRIATLPSRVAERLTQDSPYITKRVPLALPETVYFALWHQRFAAEPRLRWMLAAILELFEQTS